MNKPIITIATTLTLGLLFVPAHTQRGNTEAESFLARKERWAIKTGADPAAARIRTSLPQVTKVAKMILLQRPAELPENATSRAAQVTRYSDTESKVFTVDADILRYKLEADDHDFHIVIRDHDDFKAEDAPIESGQRRTMIVEIPDPSVVVPSSPWRSEIASARREFTRLFHPGPRFTSRVIHARITGVGYFDFIHGQSGVAPNGLEMHPVLKVEVLEPVREVTGSSSERASTDTNADPTGEIARHQVWVNLKSGVYWRPGTRYYGKTKHGQYMLEDEAIKAGYHAAGGRR